MTTKCGGEKMMESFHLDREIAKGIRRGRCQRGAPKSAKSGGIQLGPIRESLMRGSGGGLATVQLEGSGQVPAVLAFLSGLNTIGFPLL